METESGIQHRVTLAELASDTQYTYLINDRFQGTFRTPAQEEKRKFVVIGHTHGSENSNHYPDALLVDKVRALQPDFVVHTGDATFFSNVKDFKEYFFKPFRDLLKGIPIYLAPGNHDAGWPFIYGVRLDVFKALFGYPYPKEIVESGKDAFYSIEEGGVALHFFSYTSGLDKDSLQREWLRKQLSKSSATFNVVVYGGNQAAHYDEASLLDFLSQQGVDLVLNGDGMQPVDAIKYNDRMPVVFVGTAGPSPHPLLYVEKENKHMTLKLLDAVGNKKWTRWLYSKKVFERKVDLRNLRYTELRKDRQVTRNYQFDSPPSTEDITGIQFRINRWDMKKRPYMVYAYVTPDHIDHPIGSQGGFRTQFQLFDRKDKIVTLDLPKDDPFLGGAYRIKELRLSFVGLEEEESLQFKYLYLY